MVTLADYSMFTKQQLSESQEVVKLKGLGNQEVMGKLIKKNVEIHIGQLTILWDACATKLMDTVLLGLYFLSAQEGLVDLKNLTITFRHEKVCAELADSRANLTVSRVMFPENTTIFPNSMKSALVELETLIEEDYVIGPYSIHDNILISASIGRGKIGKTNIINDSNQIVKLRGGQCIGQAEPIAEVLTKQQSNINIRQSTISTDNQNNEELPPYLVELFNKSSKNLNENQNLRLNKGNNKITELRTILQRESQNSYLYKQTKSVNNRKTVKTVMTLKKWWVKTG